MIRYKKNQPAYSKGLGWNIFHGSNDEYRAIRFTQPVSDWSCPTTLRLSLQKWRYADHTNGLLRLLGIVTNKAGAAMVNPWWDEDFYRPIQMATVGLTPDCCSKKRAHSPLKPLALQLAWSPSEAFAFGFAFAFAFFGFKPVCRPFAAACRDGCEMVWYRGLHGKGSSINTI